MARGAIGRGTLTVFIIGVLPIVEKKVAKDPSRFGKGAIEGIAGSEAANNAAVAGAFVPMFVLGILGSGATAIMLGALIMFGLRPGPELFTNNADVVWAIIASMYIANVILLVLNLPLASIFAKLLTIPYNWVYPPIVVICITGVYSQANSIQDCWIMLGFGALGWAMKRHSWPAAPLILGLVLGLLFETAPRQSLTLSHGNWFVFLLRPISVGLMLAAAIVVLTQPATALIRSTRAKRHP